MIHYDSLPLQARTPPLALLLSNCTSLKHPLLQMTSTTLVHNKAFPGKPNAGVGNCTIGQADSFHLITSDFRWALNC